MTQMERREDVAVIGAGASGLAVARQLMAENLIVTVYERQSGPGGVWNYSPDPKETFSTPMYENLTTNFPRGLMEFADQRWSSETSIYPKHELVQAYIRKYADGVRIHYDREVFGLHGLTKHPRHGGKRWRVVARNESQKREWKRDFDAVVVATGTFDRWFEPDYPGLDDWKSKYPNSVLHSKSYRSAEGFRGEKVLVVGNSASGLDISSQLAGVASQVWVSSTRPNRSRDARIEAVGAISHFDPDTRSIETEDNTRLQNIDKVILCTGYQYILPFVRKGLRAEEPIWPDTFHVDSLYEHMFWIHDPSLSFVGLPKQGPTFLISQAQGAVIARYLSGRLALPSKAQMTDWVDWHEYEWEKRRKFQPNQENAKTYHNLPYPKCKEYIDRLRDLCENSATNTRRGDSGSQLFLWTDDIDWLMRNRGLIRDAFEKQGLEKHNFTTLEALGITKS